MCAKRTSRKTGSADPNAEMDRLHETVSVALCLVDRELRFILVNERMASMHGLTADNFKGKTFQDIDPSIAKQIEPQLRQVFESGEEVLDYRYSWLDGGCARHWSASYYPAHDESGETTHVSIVCQDVSEREQRRELAETRFRVEALVADVSAGFLSLSGFLVKAEINRRLKQVCELLGFERASLMEICDGDDSCLAVSHGWSAEGVPPPHSQVPRGKIPWTFNTLSGGDVVRFEAPGDLPSQAVVDRAFFEDSGVRSLIAIPLVSADATFGLLTFASVTRQRACPEELLPRLRLIGEIFVAARMRQRAEEALSTSERRYRTMIEDQEEFIIRWTPDTRRTFVNDAYCRAFGQSREALIGSSFLPMIPNESRRDVFRKIKLLTPDNPALTDEHPVIRPDGSTCWLLWNDRGIFDGDGELIEIQSVGRDVTESRRAEEALRVSEQRYRTLVENAPEAIVVFDVDGGRFVDVNENAVRLFKMERDKLLGLTPADLSPEFQPNGRSSEDEAKQWLGRALAGETPRFEWLHRDALGHDIPSEIGLVRLPSTDERKLIRGSITDITERKRLEQELRQAQKMEAIGRLAGGIAHDFNNLLTAIQGNTKRAMVRSGPDTTIEKELNEVLAASERAAALTSQLLAFSRRQRIQVQVISVNELVENLNRMLRRVIGEHIELITNLNAREHFVEADPSQLEQVIVNLAVNARDAMPRGGTLEVTTSNTVLDAERIEGEQTLAAGTYVVLEVEDSGTGITLDTQSRIFEPFFTTKEHGKGTGLGLSTAYGIVAQSHGFIQVRSEPGEGATFLVYLPCTDELPREEEADQEREVRGNETILLVEDEENVRSLIFRCLTDFGYSVLEAADGEEALRLSARHEGSIDLLVTDVIMPGMSGVDLAEKITELREDIDVLFISGYTDDLIQDYGVSGDDAALLEKPFTPEDLARKAREVLDRTRLSS